MLFGNVDIIMFDKGQQKTNSIRSVNCIFYIFKLEEQTEQVV
jgi:hypothetical protein